MYAKLSLLDYLQKAADESSGLPSMPTNDELTLIRKGLRKKVVPDITLLPKEFRYERVGHFQKKLLRQSWIFHWTTEESGLPKSRSYQELCASKGAENDRLELGWMIANFARIDAFAHLSQMRPIGYEDHHQDLFAKQYATQKRHFERIESGWRHWAIVPAGHMKFE